MSVASLKVVPEDLKTSIIRVTDYADKNLQGTFYNPYYGEEVVYSNLTQLLLLMEELMDELNCPQASTQSRRFQEVPTKAERDRLKNNWLQRVEEGTLATFKVKVLFRQGASWQGKITWVEGNMEMSFRSALEMIKLMDSALPQPKSAEEPQDEPAQHVS